MATGHTKRAEYQVGRKKRLLQLKSYLASGLYRFTDGTGRRMATKNVGDVDVVGRVNDETAVLDLAADAQER